MFVRSITFWCVHIGILCLLALTHPGAMAQDEGDTPIKIELHISQEEGARAGARVKTSVMATIESDVSGRIFVFERNETGETRLVNPEYYRQVEKEIVAGVPVSLEVSSRRGAVESFKGVVTAIIVPSEQSEVLAPALHAMAKCLNLTQTPSNLDKTLNSFVASNTAGSGEGLAAIGFTMFEADPASGNLSADEDIAATDAMLFGSGAIGVSTASSDFTFFDYGGSTGPPRGRFMHHAPQKIMADRAYVIEALITSHTEYGSLDAIDEAMIQKIGRGELDAELPELDIAAENIQIADVMSVDLISTGDVKITPVTPSIQRFSEEKILKWSWIVEATELGQAPLVFSVSEVIRTGNTERELRSIHTKSIPLNVRDIRKISEPTKDMAEEACASSFLATPECLIQRRTRLQTDGENSAVEPDTRPPEILASSGCETMSGANELRKALIISNQNYLASVGRLSETHADNRRMSSALNAVGFEVTSCQDLSGIETKRVLEAFRLQLQESENANREIISFFYYSGHGANVSGANYIIPVDQTIANELEIKVNGVVFDDIIDRIWLPNASATFAVFDACRNVLGATKGFKPVSATAFGSGLFQAYATAPGAVALDNGYYSQELSAGITTMELPADLVFNHVQKQVAARSARTQNPFNIDGLSTDVVLASSD